MKMRVPEVVFDMPTHNRFGMEYPGGGYVVVRWMEVDVPTSQVTPATGIRRAAKPVRRTGAKRTTAKPGSRLGESPKPQH